MTSPAATPDAARRPYAGDVLDAIERAAPTRDAQRHAGRAFARAVGHDCGHSAPWLCVVPWEAPFGAGRTGAEVAAASERAVEFARETV